MAGVLGVEHLHEGLDGGGVRRGDDLGSGHLGEVHGCGLGHLHGLDVGGIPGLVADEGVLADLADRQELLRRGAAHGAGRRLDDDVVEAEAVEDPDVGRAVGVVGLLQTFVGDVEGVGVLHDELAATQQPGTGASLVAVLRLDLVDRQRQVLVGAVEILDGEGEHLLVGGAEQQVGALAVLEPEEVVAVLRPPAGRLVGLARQQRGEAQLLADPVHLLADDALDAAQHREPEREPGVDPGRGATDVAGAHEQLVAGQLGVGRVLAQGPQEEGRHAHDGT